MIIVFFLFFFIFKVILSHQYYLATHIKIGKFRACLVMLFEQQFLLFKQYNTYFHNI